ncbi:MAG TPA: ribosome-associated translation inhibitor RaiA [Clostridiales bacterium]|nr:MAG: ribosomal subunit interface protein [Clostridiales bacterium GWD2_32_59]HAN10820.1 ribosome-associated translation inhibitor RaiA [Clostridiales bacterium]
MNYMISGKNIEVTEALKQKIMDKLNRLSKFLNDDTHVHVTLSVQKLQQIIEITIPIKGTILRTEVEEHDMYAAIDKAIDILEKQVVKYRSKLKDKHKHDNSFKEEFLKELHNIEHDEEVHNELKIAKIKTFDVKPMAREEAIMQMDLLGHDFFVFRDMDNERINIIYKRKGGTYGLIDPEY